MRRAEGCGVLAANAGRASSGASRCPRRRRAGHNPLTRPCPNHNQCNHAMVPRHELQYAAVSCLVPAAVRHRLLSQGAHSSEMSLPPSVLPRRPSLLSPTLLGRVVRASIRSLLCSTIALLAGPEGPRRARPSVGTCRACGRGGRAVPVVPAGGQRGVRIECGVGRVRASRRPGGTHDLRRRHESHGCAGRRVMMEWNSSLIATCSRQRGWAIRSAGGER